MRKVLKVAIGHKNDMFFAVEKASNDGHKIRRVFFNLKKCADFIVEENESSLVPRPEEA